MAKFKRYDSYKNSGIEWLGEIPSHWEMKKHKYCFVLNKEIVGNNSSNLQLLSLTKNGIKAIDKFDQSGKVPISFDTYQFISKDDIVMCLFDLDVSAVFSGISPYEGMISSAYKSFKCNSNLLPKYCDYFFRNVFVNRKYKIYSKNVRFTMNVDDFMSLYIPLPPKDEQEKIASYLDEKIAKIDAFISGKEKFIELLKEQKQIIINDAVTKGLNKNAKFKDSGVEWLGEIPSHWKNIKTTHIFNRIGSGTTPTSTNTKYYDGEINWLQTGDLADDIIYKTSKKITHKALKDFSTLKIYPKNSLVIAMYGATIGKVGILDIETTTNQACCVLSDTKQILEKYAFYWFLASKNNIISLGYGGGQPNISQDLIKSLRITLPPKSEQEKIVEYIETKTAKIDKLVNLEQEYIKSLKEYKASLIDSVVTGKVRIV